MKFKKDAQYFEAKIYSLASSQQETYVILEDKQKARLLPIEIGNIAASSIAIRFTGIAMPRPITQDLFLPIVEHLGGKIKFVSIDNFEKETYYSSLALEKEGGEIKFIDMRPSDALAISVRAGCPIWVADDVLEKTLSVKKPISDSEISDFKSNLDELGPKKFFEQLKKDDN
ncbi:MAG: bifunctional nuclease family protein [Elusimicrobiaceae bacterium]|jgi:uncharacterized protein|nr:bifunctional nuclease family protein [Elusimicrobiaceae bacterium]MBT3954737.1 bifunctional nuclease family protein [Elusimicrobiaceae bacterium]MBT4008329.1 bifunctional nuclease family protein [Elusimicrobiaceae bacterium]MBT4403061.1 bifunctional nuclease family protein [Elusimicrobiaceae bacterium]MBT4439377.1 bifunctional nuclease family protein [Elusimicrobiaceae bacterium]